MQELTEWLYFTNNKITVYGPRVTLVRYTYSVHGQTATKKKTFI